MRPLYGCVVALAGVATARPAAARSEISARVPVGVAVGESARLELGLRADLLYVFESSELGIGLTGGVRSIAFSSRAQEIGAAFAMQDDVNLVLDAGVGTEGARRYLHARGTYQLSVRLDDDDRGFAYACSSAIFLDVRSTVSGPGRWEAIGGIEIGGGLLAALYASTRH